MRCYRSTKAEVPTGKYTVEIGKANVSSEGDDVTIFAWGAMVMVAEKAAAEMKKQGVSCEVVDVRTLYPLDKETISASVQKTGRAVIIHEAHATGGVGSDLIGLINDTSFPLFKSTD